MNELRIIGPDRFSNMDIHEIWVERTWRWNMRYKKVIPLDNEQILIKGDSMTLRAIHDHLVANRLNPYYNTNEKVKRVKIDIKGQNVTSDSITIADLIFVKK